MRRLIQTESGRLVVAMATLAVVCVSFATSAGAKVQATELAKAAKPTLTIGGSGFCHTTFSPVGAGNTIANEVKTWAELVYEAPIRVTAAREYGPGLATAWSVKPGNKVMTLTLRRNARFSDGTPVDAEALKASIEANREAGAGGTSSLGPIRSIEVLSKYVVRVTLKSPNPSFVPAMSSRDSFVGGGVVISPKAIADWKANPRSPAWARRTFGAGPYVLLPQETVIGDRCTFVPNKYYYDKSRQKWGKIVFKHITDPNATLAAMRTGQLDFASGAVETAEAARARGIRVIQGGEGVHFLRFQETGQRTQALRDVRVRQAMNYAIDRKKIATALYGVWAHPTSSPARGLPGSDPKFDNYYPYNPAKARSLLAAAGYPNGFSVKLFTIGSWWRFFRLEEHTQAAVRDLAAVGIKVDYDSPANVQQFSAALANPAYSIYSGAGNPIDFLTPIPPGQSSPGQFRWRDPVMLRLWLKGLRAGGKAQLDIRRQLIQRSITQAYWVPLFNIAEPLFVGKRVKGVPQGGAAVPATDFLIHPADWSPA